MSPIRLAIFVTAFLISALRSYGYGAEGHTVVGAIADDKLAGTPAGQEVGKLLDGITLAQAAVFPDMIKSWDKNGPGQPGGFHVEGHPEIEKQLEAFVKANPNPAQPPENPDQADPPSHHWFHYSDVPVLDSETYESGKAGRSRWDIAHMIDYCIRVLRGEEPAENARAITKPVAAILLAHYLGDIHQPLHVGAEYFDQSGQPSDPDKGTKSLADAGGNSIFLLLNGAPRGEHHTLHSYWDTPAVLAAFQKIERFGKISPTADIPTIAKYMATREPLNWKIPPGVPLDDVGQYLADDILPTAKAAHDRLTFQHMQPKVQYGETLESGFARERAMPDGISYADWSAMVTADELDKAGWRLASLLQRIFSPANVPSPPKSSPAPSAFAPK